MKIPQEIQNIFKEDRVVPFGTVSSSGTPNINMVAIKKLLDDETILLVDNYFKKTLQNLEENKNAALVTKNEAAKKWYQLKGTCHYLNEGDEYEGFKKWVRTISDTLPAKGMVIFKVEEIFNVTSGPDAGKQIFE